MYICTTHKVNTMKILTKTREKNSNFSLVTKQYPNDTVTLNGLNAYKRICKMVDNGIIPSLSLNEINEEIRLYREGK